MQSAQVHLRARMKKERSSVVPTAAWSTGWKKLGQPVPESNFASESNSSLPQQMQVNMPSRFSSLSGLVKARSVPCWRATR